MNCRDCKHWKVPADLPDYPLERYVDMDQPYEALPRDAQHQHRLCSAVPRVDYYIPHPDPPPLAFTQDASGCMALLWTAPDFGCVLFEAFPQGAIEPRCTIASANTLGRYYCSRESGHEGPCAAWPTPGQGSK
jgi:hypothetical protein